MQLLASFSSYSSGDIYNRILSSNFEGQSGISLTLVSYTHLILVVNGCGSTYENGCIVDGMCAMAAD